jgi:hypothetical protein
MQTLHTVSIEEVKITAIKTIPPKIETKNRALKSKIFMTRSFGP